MTRRTGQVGPRELLVGLLVATGVMVAMVRSLAPLQPSREPVPRPVGAAAPDVVAQVEDCATLPARLEDDDVTSTLLVTCPEAFDNRRVVYTGEVVGAVLQRDTGAWVQLNDDVYGLSIGPLPEHGQAAGASTGVAVVLPPDAARRIEYVGSGRASGDVLRVTGTFSRADPGDGGGPAIRASQVERVRRGRTVEQQVEPFRVPVAVAAVLLAAATAVAARRSRREG